MLTPTLCLAIFSSVLGMFQFGYGSGSMNAPQALVEAFLQETFESRYGVKLDHASAASWFSVAVTVYVVGGMAGALAGGAMGDKLGRRRSLIIAQVPALMGASAMGICKLASSYELLLLGRLLHGFACGVFTSVAPVYVSEVAPARLRGAMGTLNQLAVASGIFASMGLGLSEALGTERLWPLLLSLPLLPALVQAAILPHVPESPHFLINGLEDMAAGRRAVLRLHGPGSDVNGLVEDVQAEQEDNQEQEGMSVRQLLAAGKFRLPLFVCVCLHLSQQLSGINAIFFYSTSFFEDAGIPGSASRMATLGVGAVMVVMTLVTVPLVDRVGRRVLHLAGLGGIIVCSVCLTVALVLMEAEGPGELGPFLVAFTLAFVAFFALGPGSIPWLAPGEVFTQSSRGPAVSVCVFVNWLGNLVVGLSFPQLQHAAQSLSFVPFLCCTAVLLAILTLHFPETKNHSPSDILALFQVPNPWRHFVGFKKVVDRSADSFQAVDTNSYGSLM